MRNPLWMDNPAKLTEHYIATVSNFQQDFITRITKVVVVRRFTIGVYPVLARKDIALQKIRSLVDQSQVGDRLPSEDQLAAVCDVSRPTVRAALITLETEGRVLRRQGLGTYVAQPPHIFHPPIDALWSVFDIVSRSGFRPSISDVTITDEVMHQKANRTLQLPSDARVTEISRTVMADEQPGVYLQDYIAPTGSAHQFQSFDGETLAQFLWDQCHIRLSYALSNISVMGASHDISHALSVPLGAPILFIEQTAYTEQHDPVVYSLGFYREGLITYTVTRHTDTSSKRRYDR